MTRRTISVCLIALIVCQISYAQSPNPNRTPVVSSKLQVQLTKNGTSEESEGWDAWIVVGTNKRSLPPIAIREDNGELLDESNKLPIQPEFSISPNGQWIFATQKLWHTAAVGYLYKRKAGLDFVAGTSLRFDEAAWRYYAQKHGIKAAKLPKLSNGERIIDCVGWSSDSTVLLFRLRPVKSSKNSEWLGAYDVLNGRFAPTIRGTRR